MSQELHLANLPHLLPEASEQLQAGLYLTKRTYTFMKKLGALRRTFAKDALALTKHERTQVKAERVEKDQMGQFVALYKRMLQITEAEMERSQEYCKQIATQVVEPLEKFYKEQNKVREKIITQAQKVQTKVEAAQSKIDKERPQCVKAWSQLEEVHESAKIGDSGDTKKIAKHVTNCIKRFKKLEDQVRYANTVSRDYQKILSQMETVEIRRLKVLGTRIGMAAEYYSDMVADYPKNASELLVSIGNVCGADQYRTWLETKLMASPQTAEDFFASGLPCASQDLKIEGSYVKYLSGCRKKAASDQKSDTRLERSRVDILKRSKQSSTGKRKSLNIPVQDTPDSSVSKATEDLDTDLNSGEESSSGEYETDSDDDLNDGDLAAKMYRQMFGCDPGELGHPMLQDNADWQTPVQAAQNERGRNGSNPGRPLPQQTNDQDDV